MKIHIVIGKNFGDEGKGLATDYFAHLAQKEGVPCLVIRHNGGAQAGHTVELPGKRFVFHQLASGSFRNADTLWADTFLPDLYKLEEEIEAFSALSGFVPRIWAFPQCRCVLIDDVLINMALEESRGNRRHGSCGMGINEAVERSKSAHFALRLADAAGRSCDSLAAQMLELRRAYTLRRLEELSLSMDQLGEYGELLQNPLVIRNAAEAMCRAAERITLAEPDAAGLERWGKIVFEGAQGLLLDAEHTEYAPYLTPSRTGMHNPGVFCKKHFASVKPEAVYVSRTYVTRHGAGPLPHEGRFSPEAYGVRDLTNAPNPWQGRLRFAPHGDFDRFFAPVRADVRGSACPVTVSLLLTHCNETNGKMMFAEGQQDIDHFAHKAVEKGLAETVYFSASKYAPEITKCGR